MVTKPKLGGVSSNDVEEFVRDIKDIVRIDGKRTERE
jgi:hypothetical protein